MKFGVSMFQTPYAIRPAALAVAAEERGFESLFFPEHTHIPCSRKTPFPRGGELPKEYIHSMDPFVALATAVEVTKTIRLGLGVCLVIERDPITLAKEVSSLDFLSGGRVILGAGGGWNVEEMANHGTDFRTRWKLLRERIEAMKAIWANDEASYSGDLVRFDPIWSFPKPVQKPHPPILLGGRGEVLLKRVVAYADGWIPLPRNLEEIHTGLATLDRLAAEAGRARSTISVSIFFAPPDEDLVRTYEDLGIDRVIFKVPPEGPETVLPHLDRCARLLR
jgi:probable F420-dependent oxidoreductase